MRTLKSLPKFISLLIRAYLAGTGGEKTVNYTRVQRRPQLSKILQSVLTVRPQNDLDVWIEKGREKERGHDKKEGDHGGARRDFSKSRQRDTDDCKSVMIFFSPPSKSCKTYAVRTCSDAQYNFFLPTPLHAQVRIHSWVWTAPAIALRG
jgi:hypothetical protein